VPAAPAAAAAGAVALAPAAPLAAPLGIAMVESSMKMIASTSSALTDACKECRKHVSHDDACMC